MSGLEPLSLEDWVSARPERKQAFLLAGVRGVLVLTQPDLRRQGETYGRMVAFLEKSGMPRTRVPTQHELAQWLERTGQRIETLTLGNNLSAARVALFFNFSRWQREPLSQVETELLGLLLKWRVLVETDIGYAAGDGPALLITFPRASHVEGCESCEVSEAESLAIFGHEYQHARYFSSPVLQHYTEWYWFNRVPLLQKQKVLRLLEKRGYDTTQQALLLDEFHAFLAQADDGSQSPRRDADAGMEVFREIRRDFLKQMVAFEAGKGPAVMLPPTPLPSIQGEQE